MVTVMALVEWVQGNRVRGGGAGPPTVAVPAAGYDGDGAPAGWTGGVHFCVYSFGFWFWLVYRMLVSEFGISILWFLKM
jgi:hypothetical protein